jgi:hypothetical protein
MLWIGLSLVGTALALLNLRGTLRIWRSGIYEREQLLAQTVLIWIVPGSVFAVVYILKDDRPKTALGDPTVANPDSPGEASMGAGHHGAP